MAADTSPGTCRGTSRPTLSAYENGRTSPTLGTIMRILHAAGADLAIEERIDFPPRMSRRGRPISVPTRLPRLPFSQAFARGPLPLHLNWSSPTRVYDLADRADRRLAYEIVLREGTPQDILRYVDGALLVDLWPDLTLPRDIRAAWQPLITQATVASQAAP